MQRADSVTETRLRQWPHVDRGETDRQRDRAKERERDRGEGGGGGADRQAVTALDVGS